VENWMNTLEALMEENRYPESFIFNFDETMLAPSQKPHKVVVPAGSPRPVTAVANKKEHITIALCIAADGSKLQPLCILPLRNEPNLPDKVRQFYIITGQDAGWIDEEIWNKWIAEIFIPEIQRRRKEQQLTNQRALLIVDAHSTRSSATAIALLQQYGVDLLVIPAHSSTILQPLDLTVNGIFKHYLGEHYAPQADEPKDCNRIRLLATSVLALEIALARLHITLGFARAGIWPFNKEAPLNSALVRHPIHSIVVHPRTRGKRGPKIAGRLLTAAPSSVPAIEQSGQEGSPKVVMLTE
jgi:hypothetical protein